MQYFTIHKEDVGARSIYAFGQQWEVTDFLDRILPQDVGKRVYFKRPNDSRAAQILSAESHEQMMARLCR